MLLRARIQAHITRTFLIGYAILLVVLLIAALITVFIALNISERPSLHSTQWWYFDVPWFLLTLAAWIPIAQLAYYRRAFVTLDLNDSERSCLIEGSMFAGKWAIKKKYPQRMHVARAMSIILLMSISLMLVLDAGMLHFAWHTPLMGTNIANKVIAVQLLCLLIMLSSSLVRMWTYWKYPNAVFLLRRGEWLSLQFADSTS